MPWSCRVKVSADGNNGGQDAADVERFAVAPEGGNGRPGPHGNAVAPTRESGESPEDSNMLGEGIGAC